MGCDDYGPEAERMMNRGFVYRSAVEGVRDERIDTGFVTKFITRDSGTRAEFASGMVRDTQTGKPRWDLIVPEGVPYEAQLLTRFAALMARGAEKYSARNWEQANSQEELDRMKASAFRHFMQWFCGEQDEDHAAAVLFNLMAYEATAYKMAQDGLGAHDLGG